MANKKKNNKKKDWVKTAIKHPGAFRKWCIERGYSGANTACIQSGMKPSKPITIRRRAILANNLKKMRAKRKKK